MPLEYQGAQVPTSYATCSIGHSDAHTLPEKLKAIAAAGFDGIELSMPDILSYGAQLQDNGKPPAEDDYDALTKIAEQIGKLTRDNGLRIMMLQPFANFEGWPRDSPERADAFKRAKGWSRIMQAAGTDLLQIGSSDAPGIADATPEDMAADLAELADILAEKGQRIAFENWCWATKAPGWRDVWDIVKRADRSNLGLCLDTFQSAGGEWADPTTNSRLVEKLGQKQVSSQEVNEAWKQSLSDLAATVPAEKIFLLQISDAYRLDTPLDTEPDADGLRPRGRWSHDYRPLPFDGGYLPVKEFLDAVLATAFRGWLSMEVFDGRGKEKYDNMQEYSEKAMASLQRLLSE